MKLIEQPVIDNGAARQLRRHDRPPVPPPSPSSPGVHHSAFKDPISRSASPLTPPSSELPARLSEEIILFCSPTGQCEK